MPQIVHSHCPQCGAEAVPEQRFCPNCGFNMQTSLPPAISVLKPERHQPEPLPKIPVSSGSQLRMEDARRAIEPSPFATIAHSPTLEADLRNSKRSLSDVPTTLLATSGKKTSRRLFFLILPAVFLLVLGSFAGWLWYSNNVQPAITTRTLQTPVYYAGLLYQITTVEQSQRFLDDPKSSQTGMLRVHMQVQNPFAHAVSLIDSQSARLLLPGGKSQEFVANSLNTQLKANGTQSGYLDFRVPTQTSLAAVSLQLGRTNEAQVLIPLNGHVDLKKYASQKTTLHATLQYQGLNWTLVSASSELGRDGQQAKSGMRYLTLALSVDNPLAQIVIPGSPFDYMRLNVGSQSLVPQETTLPVSFAANSTGKAGTVTFLIPQNAPAQTFVLLAQAQNGFAEATQVLSIS